MQVSKGKDALSQEQSAHQMDNQNNQRTRYAYSVHNRLCEGAMRARPRGACGIFSAKNKSDLFVIMLALSIEGLLLGALQTPCP